MFRNCRSLKLVIGGFKLSVSSKTKKEMKFTTYYRSTKKIKRLNLLSLIYEFRCDLLNIKIVSLGTSLQRNKVPLILFIEIL